MGVRRLLDDSRAHLRPWCEEEVGGAVEQFDEELDGRIARHRGDETMERPIVDVLVAASAIPLPHDERSDLVDPVLVEAVRGDLGSCRLDRDPRFEELVDVGLHEEQVDRDGIDDGVDRRGGDDEPATGAAPHAGDVLEFDDPGGLAEHGAADAVALQQVGLRAEHRAFGPPERRDVGDDPISDVGRQLVAVTRGRPTLAGSG